MSDALQIRRALPADRAAILELLARALGWARDDGSTQFYEWKHHENPFGDSLEWLALVDGEVVGYRAFLRWRFDRAGRRIDAVRAVDTATNPMHRRQGIFEALTRVALEALTEYDVEFVFNTPNPRSGAGYTKMGWVGVGRIPVAARIRTAAAFARVATAARSAAQRQAEPTRAGAPAQEALSDADAVEALLARCAPLDDRLRTAATSAYLQWRYANPALGYRVITGDAGLAEGLVVFRVRRRGRATEAMLCDAFVPPDAGRLRGELERRVLRETRADYLLRVALPSQRRGTGVRVPGQGPLLVWRGLAGSERPPLDRWALALGDLEMF